MVTQKNETHVSGAGFFEKNFHKLKDGQHLEYMLSRIILFITGVTVGLYYLRDAFTQHSSVGIPESILFSAAIIFLMNGLRKMVRGFIKLREVTWDGSVVEKPHNPGESWFMRAGFRFPLGQRRHLVSVMTLTSEGFAALLMALSFFCAEVTFPKNMWWGLVITGVARILSYLNSSIFLTKIPHVRKALTDTLKELPNSEHLLLLFPFQAYKLFRSIGSSGEEQSCNEDAARGMAERILNEYPEEVISGAQKKKLHPELVDVICREHDPLKLIQFLGRRIAEFKSKEKS